MFSSRLMDNCCLFYKHRRIYNTEELNWDNALFLEYGIELNWLPTACILNISRYKIRVFIVKSPSCSNSITVCGGISVPFFQLSAHTPFTVYVDNTFATDLLFTVITKRLHAVANLTESFFILMYSSYFADSN